jgi:hypothetical protein
MVKYTLEDSHAEFIIKVLASNGITFHLADRYSSLRQFQSLVRKDLDRVNFNFLPRFPEKKLLGKMDPKFLQDRMTQLGLFFNSFLGNKDVAQNKLVMTYFASKAMDQESLNNVSKLNELIKQASQGGYVAEPVT